MVDSILPKIFPPNSIASDMYEMGYAKGQMDEAEAIAVERIKLHGSDLHGVAKLIRQSKARRISEALKNNRKGKL